jgi:small nuclear ribonucleoprotein (snRNP)-like protein
MVKILKLNEPYMMRRTTVKMLNKLKGMSEYVDIHMNAIVDNAIREAYFRALLKEKNKSL